MRHNFQTQNLCARKKKIDYFNWMKNQNTSTLKKNKTA